MPDHTSAPTAGRRIRRKVVLFSGVLLVAIWVLAPIGFVIGFGGVGSIELVGWIFTAISWWKRFLDCVPQTGPRLRSEGVPPRMSARYVAQGVVPAPSSCAVGVRRPLGRPMAITRTLGGTYIGPEVDVIPRGWPLTLG